MSIVGERLTDRTASVPDGQPLPRELAGVEVYVDGIAVPIQSISPTQINAQLPWEVADAQSASAVVRSRLADGTVSVSSPVAVPIIAQNPGIFANDGIDPRPGVVLHGSDFPTATISVDGTPKENDRVTVIFGGGREYTYTVTKDDATNRTTAEAVRVVRDRLVETITRANGGLGDPEVEVYAAGLFARMRVQARLPGKELEGVPVATRVSDGAGTILTATNAQLCCANRGGSLVTQDNPAVPGETLIVYATGLGRIKPDDAQAFVKTGEVYNGPEANEPVEFVSALAGGKTANVLFARLKPGTIGLYEIVLELNTDLPTNDQTQLTIAQSFQVSNIVSFPLKNPKDDQSQP